MNLQQTLLIIADLAYAVAQASGQHQAGDIASGNVNVAVYLSPGQKKAIQELALACALPEEEAAPVEPAPTPADPEA